MTSHGDFSEASVSVEVVNIREIFGELPFGNGGRTIVHFAGIKRNNRWADATGALHTKHRANCLRLRRRHRRGESEKRENSNGVMETAAKILKVLFDYLNF